jgi:hypothetical protein
MRTGPFSLSLAKPIQNAEAISKIYEPFIFGDINYITNSFCENGLKIVTRYPRL